MRIAVVALTLVAPVPGVVGRAFEYGPDPFRAGQHRGVDLAARPGDAVRAACSGRVAAARWRVVTLRCGEWRVTHLPLASVGVRAGERVRAGSVVGRLGSMPDHRGLHLGVRRASNPFGYVDPLPLLHAPREIPRAGPVGTPRPAPPPTRNFERVRVFAPARARGLAPWPAWVGLAVLLLGAVGGGVRIRARRRLAPLAEARAERVPSAP